MMAKRLSWVACGVLLMAAVARGGESAAVVEAAGRGRIDWTAGRILAAGRGVPPEGDVTEAAGRTMALRAAVLDAGRNLLSAAKAVRIRPDLTVAGYAGADDPMMAKVENMIREAGVVSQEYLAGGTVEVTVALALTGGFAQLLLPPEIRQIQSIRPIYAPEKGDDASRENRTPHTGMVLDARGLSVLPALFPRVVDENGREVYGAAFVSREFAVESGVSGYAKKEGNFARVGKNPLWVKGLRVAGPGRSDIMISNKDASTLLGDSAHLRFLKECRVVIVVD